MIAEEKSWETKWKLNLNPCQNSNSPMPPSILVPQLLAVPYFFFSLYTMVIRERPKRAANCLYTTLQILTSI